MDLVTGMGLNSQIGDFTAFFFALSAFLPIGVVRDRCFIMAAMLLLGSAACSILASLFHDAPLLSVAVVFELVGTAVFAVLASIEQISVRPEAPSAAFRQNSGLDSGRSGRI